MEEKKERVIFLEGNKVILRPPDKEKDLEKCLIWINNQNVLQYLSLRFPASRLEEEKWFEKQKENTFTFAIETKEGLYIGNIGLHNINYLNGTADLGIMIGDQNYWSKGFGFDAEMTLFHYAFTELNLRKITHCAFRLNKRSVGLAKKCGGVREGILRQQIFKNNQYQDMILFAIFKKRWVKIWKEYAEKFPSGEFEH